jgi:hypothetical protein
MRRVTVARRVLSAALSVGLLAASPRPARADTVVPVVGIGVALALVTAVDLTFFGYDTWAVVEGHLPAKGWAIAETAVGAPQAILANALYISVAHAASAKDPTTAVFLLLPIGLTSMSTHGVWGAATTNVRPAALYGYSPLIGTNLVLTAAALGQAAKRRLAGLPLGIAQTVLTAPQIALGAVQIARDDPRNRGIWISHTAWTTALLAHGITSIIAGAREEQEQPPPLPRRPGEPEEEEPAKPPLHVPSPTPTAAIMPGLVTDGVARAPGLVIAGQF